MKEAVIVSAVRTPVGKAPKGMYRTTRAGGPGGDAIRAALERAPGLDPAEIDDVILGCAFPEAEQGLNVGRNCALLAGLPESVPGVTAQPVLLVGAAGHRLRRAGHHVRHGRGHAGRRRRVHVAGARRRQQARCSAPTCMDASPDVYLSMGLTAENVASRFNVSREEQDAFAAREPPPRARGHRQRHLQRRDRAGGGQRTTLPGPDGTIVEKSTVITVDEGPRPGSTVETLAKLKPVFKKNGTVTAGNSSQTSDGAGSRVVMSAEKAAALGPEAAGPLRVVRRRRRATRASWASGRSFAIPKALKLAGLTVDDIDLVELNEAFASQAVYCMRELGLDPAIVNVNGGAIALGHPLGATGAKLTATLLHEMQRRQSRYGVVSMCVAGGIGAAAVFERLSD